MKFGVIYPQMPAALGAVVPYAEAARLGGHRLWFGHSSALDSVLVAGALAARGYSIPFGTAVALFPLWHPHGFAVQARSVAQLSGHSFVAGIGPGATIFQEKTLGTALDRPVTETVRFARRTDEILSAGPGAGAPRRVQLGFGVLRPAMARAAGSTAHWAITWLTPGPYLRDQLIPVAAEAARAAGRPAPRFATVVHVGIRRAGRDPVALAHSASDLHLASPHYATMLQQAGVPVDTTDTVRGAHALVDSGTYLYGTVEEVVDGLAELELAGVDEVVINVFGVRKSLGEEQAYADLEEILAEVHSRQNAQMLTGLEVRPPTPQQRAGTPEAVGAQESVEVVAR